MIARGPEAVAAAHRLRCGQPGGTLGLGQLLGRRNHELRQQEQRNHGAPGQFEHRSDDSVRGYTACPHRRQFTARRKGAQSEKAGEQHRGGHELQEPRRRGQQHVNQGVDQPIVPFTDVVELIDKLQQAEQRCQAGGHEPESLEGGDRDVTLQQPRAPHVMPPFGAPTRRRVVARAARRSPPRRATPALSTAPGMGESHQSGPRCAPTRRAGSSRRRSRSRSRLWRSCADGAAHGKAARPTGRADSVDQEVDRRHWSSAMSAAESEDVSCAVLAATALYSGGSTLGLGEMENEVIRRSGRHHCHCHSGRHRRRERQSDASASPRRRAASARQISHR